MAFNSDTVRTMQQDNVRLKDENAQLRGELLRLQQAVRALSSIQQRLDMITPQTNAITLINSLLEAALEAVNSEDGSLQLLDEEKNELVFVDVHGGGRDTLRGYRLPMGQGIAGWVATHRSPELVPDVRLEPRFSPLADQASGFRTLSLMCVPLLDGARTLGVIEVVNSRSGEPFTQKDLELLLLVARLASLALVRAEGSRP
jgi:GAF domain-containing protein